MPLENKNDQRFHLKSFDLKKIRKYLLHMAFCLTIFALTLFAFVLTAHAMEAPTAKEIEQYKKDGTLDKRISFAKELGDGVMDSALVQNSKLQIHKMMKSSSYSTQTAVLDNMMPSKGNVKIPVFVVDFSDAEYSVGLTNGQIKDEIFDPDDTGSLTSFYSTSSYNQLNISGDVYGVYRAKHPLSYYKAMEDQTQARNTLVEEVLNYFNDQGLDFTQYDSNKDSYIDGFYILWEGNTGGWGSTWSTYVANWLYPEYTLDGLKIRRFLFYAFQQEGDSIFIESLKHETGHLLGLPDYYSYDMWDESDAPLGGVGGSELMDACSGYFGVFSKFLLGWVTPQVVTTGTKNIVLKPISGNADGLIIMPDWDNNAYSEYYMVEYLDKYPIILTSPGLRIFHIDARTSEDGKSFLYNNSWTEHKLIRMMEADGLEEIELGLCSNDNDFYRTGGELSPDTYPNSDGYGGKFTGIKINDISTGGDTASMDVSFTNIQAKPTVVRSFPANGASGIDTNINMQVIFDNSIYKDSDFSSISLKDQNNKSVSVTCTINNNTLSIVPTARLRDSQNYKLIIPAGSLQNALGSNLDTDNIAQFKTTSGAADGWGEKISLSEVPYSFQAVAASETSDGGKIVTVIGSNKDYVGVAGLIKFDSKGTIIKKSFYDSATYGNFSCIQKIEILPDGETLVICGGIVYLYNYDLKEIWEKTTNGNARIFALKNGNIGVFENGGTKYAYTVYTEYSLSGEVIQQKTISDHNIYSGSKITNGFLIVVYADTNSETNKFQFIKVDENLNIVNTKTTEISNLKRSASQNFLFPQYQTDDCIRMLRIWNNTNVSIIKLGWDMEIQSETQLASKAIYAPIIQEKEDGTVYVLLQLKLKSGDNRKASVFKIESDNKTEWEKNISYNDGNLDPAAFSSLGSINKIIVCTYVPKRTFQEISLEGPLNNYYIYYNSQGGSSIATKTTYGNKIITKPANPTRGGYSFKGWYKEANCINEWNFTSDKVTCDLTLYAKWIKAYTIAFKSMGGKSVSSMMVESNNLIPIPVAPTRIGYSFIGWYKQQSYKTLWDFKRDRVTGDITLYAKWKILSKYTIDASANKSSYGSVKGSGKYYSGKTVTLIAVPKQGYRFVKWIEGNKKVSASYKYIFNASKNRKLKSAFEKIEKTSNISATSTGYSSVNLKWKSVEGAAGYNVYRSTHQQSGYKYIGKSNSTGYTDTGLNTGTKYYYKIKVYCLAGPVKTTGAFSSYISVKPVSAKNTSISKNKATLYQTGRISFVK